MNYKIFLIMIFGVSLMFTGAALPQAHAAVDMFLKLDGIPGESQDNTHKDEIDILAWSWGMSNSVTSTTGTGGTRSAGVADFQDVSVVKTLDKSTPLILLRAASGQVIPTADLSFVRSGGSPATFLVVHLDKVLVSSYSTSSSGGDVPTEQISLNFEKIKVTYTEFDSTGGSKGNVEFNWDVTKNAPS